MGLFLFTYFSFYNRSNGFALFQSGFIIFEERLSTDSSPVTAELGFTGIGYVEGYSWPDIITKFRNISKGLFGKYKQLNIDVTKSNAEILSVTLPKE